MTQIAYTMAQGRGHTDQLLWQVAETCIKLGIVPAGAVQINSACDDDQPCDMDVQVLPDGPRIRISQNLGAGSQGCRLDPAALEQAVSLSRVALRQGAECLFVNKFGKHEAQGRGFREVIVAALDYGIPIVIGVNSLNLGAFFAFAGDLAEPVQPDRDQVLDWLLPKIGSTGFAPEGERIIRAE